MKCGGWIGDLLAVAAMMIATAVTMVLLVKLWLTLN